MRHAAFHDQIVIFGGMRDGLITRSVVAVMDIHAVESGEVLDLRMAIVPAALSHEGADARELAARKIHELLEPIHESRLAGPCFSCDRQLAPEADILGRGPFGPGIAAAFDRIES